MKHIATIFSLVLILICGCKETQEHKDIDIFGLTGNIRNITIIRTTDKPCLQTGIKDKTTIVSFKDGYFTDINGCVFYSLNDTTYIDGEHSQTGNPPADAYFFRKETEKEGLIFEGKYYSAEDSPSDWATEFKTQMTFDASCRIGTIKDNGFMTQILGMEPDAEASTITYDYTDNSAFPTGMTYIIYIGSDSIRHKLKFDYSKTDSAGNWTERKALFVESGKTAYKETRKIDYWD